MLDPSTQFLADCVIIGTPKYVDPKLGEFARKKNEEFKKWRAELKKQLPSPSEHVDERNVFTIDKVF